MYRGCNEIPCNKLLYFAARRVATKEGVWLIAVGHDLGAFEYIDQQGYLSGFTHDIIREVCGAINETCETVWDIYTNCMNSAAGQHSFGGQGLMGYWYDACGGWYTTVGRTMIYNFSKPFMKGPKSYFYTKPGNPGNFDPLNVTGKKIVFIDGFASDEKCLARQTNVQGSDSVPPENIVHANGAADFVAKLINGSVDAGFCAAPDLETYVSNGDIEKIEAQEFSCLVAGNAMMTRKDSRFNEMWNRGFDKILNNGRFERICKDAKKKHGAKGTIECIDV